MHLRYILSVVIKMTLIFASNADLQTQKDAWKKENASSIQYPDYLQSREKSLSDDTGTNTHMNVTSYGMITKKERQRIETIKRYDHKKRETTHRNDKT